MSHTKPITIGISLNFDFNINLFENEKYVLDKSSSSNKNLDSFTKKYHEYCTLFTLNQLIKCPTRTTCSNSSILDHVPASFLDRFSQNGVIDVGISDHQLIYYTRKNARIKRYCRKQITFRSIKNHSPEVYQEALRKLSLTTLTKLMKTSFKRS